LTGDRYQGFVFPPAEMAEAVDLDEERRREILWTEAHLAGWTHWEVLGLSWNAPPEQAKAAYLVKVKVFHPDRYPGKRLGTFRPRMERVFRRLTEARDVLADPDRRAAYARQTAPPDEFARMEARKIEDERRAGERRARLARSSPLLARAARVAELVARGKQAFAEGRFGAAANDFLTAAGIDPASEEVKALAAEARKKAGVQKANELYERGLQASMAGSTGQALAAFREALEADPRHPRAAIQGSRAALALGDAAAARELAEAAVRAAPGMGAAHEALGLVLAATGAGKEAKKELERALELDPNLEAARERLKKLRWSFLG